jgi:hypothetical protein
MELKLTDDQVKAAVAGAIASLMTGEQRAALIEKAIAGLLTEPYREGSYGRETTRMQAIFRDALVDFARKEVGRLIEQDAGLREKFASVVREGVDKAFEKESRETLVNAIDGGVRAFFDKGRY